VVVVVVMVVVVVVMVAAAMVLAVVVDVMIVVVEFVFHLWWFPICRYRNIKGFSLPYAVCPSMLSVEVMCRWPIGFVKLFFVC
jgi:hypothetical protein